MRTLPKFAALVGTVALAAGSLTAATGTAGASAKTAKANGSPVTLFTQTTVANPTTSVFPETFDGAQAVANRINKTGGLGADHHKVVVKTCDDKGDNNEGLACARDAVSSGAIAEIGSRTQNEAAVMPVLEAASISYIAPRAVGAVGLNSKVAFNLDGSSTWGAAAAAEALIEAGCKHLGEVSIGGPAAVFFAKAITFVGKSHGLPAAVDIQAPSITSDPSPVVAQLQQQGVDCYVSGHSTSELPKYLTALKTLAPNIKVGLLSSVFSEQIAAQIGSAAENNLVADPYQPIHSKIKTMKHFRKDVVKVNPRTSINLFSLQPYLGGLILQQVLKDVSGQLTAPIVLGAMNKATHVDLGVGPVWDFTKSASANPAFSRVFSTEWGFYKVAKGGKFVPISGKKVKLVDLEPIMKDWT